MASADSTFPQWKYDVFLSFRGEDTRKTFTDHLYAALVKNGFYTFRGDEMHEKGEEIAPEFLTAIEESKIFMLVFSENYASSRWCLDVLETIIESMKKPGHMVVPVFYHVDPSEVRNQTGSYGESFLNHERAADEEEKKEKVKRWRGALREASNLVGWHLQNQHESQLIKEIITDILRRLNCELLQVDYDTVGMEFRLKKLLSLINLKLDEVLKIGINGISGIGKTTIAKAIYNKISYHFQRTIFLRGHHLNLPRFQQLLDDASMGTQRVLLVVDDVYWLNQVEYLVKLRDSFSLRSRIIFTTRDRHLLNVAKLDGFYEAEGLTDEEAIQLFSWHAFKQTFPKEDYVDLVKLAVGYAEGHPLALKVLGSSLFGKTITEWECILHKLRKSTHRRIYKALKVSFDGLTPTEQEIFLKVVCLLKGKDEESVSTILDSLGLGSESGIQALHDMCLATISNNKLYMHDLLQHMGQKLRSRLQDPKGVYPQFKGNTGTEETQETQLSSAGSQKMPELFSLMPLLLKSLPLNFPADSLFSPDLSYSNIRQLWKGNKILGNLEAMILNNCSNLEKISKFSSMPALKIPNLEGCKKLRSLPSSICELKCLEGLCSGCSNLGAFPENTQVMTNLKKLNFPGLGIKELPSSIGCLSELHLLDLKSCKKFDSLPNRMGNLKQLDRIDLFASFPAINIQLCELKALYLRHCKSLQSLPELPSSIEYLDAPNCIPLETLSTPSLSPWKRQSWPSVLNYCKWKIQELESRSCLPCPENDPPSWVSRGFDTVIPGSQGIPEWISCQRGCEVKIELPMNWYEHKGFLGFVLCSVYVPHNAPSGREFENSPVHATHTWHLECKLINQIGDVDFLAFGPTRCECYFNGGPSKQIWLSYYPKVALKKKYFSNEWSPLIASFKGYHSDTPLEVKECGVHLIYARSDQHDNLLAESLDDAGPIVVESDSFDVGQQPCLEG